MKELVIKEDQGFRLTVRKSQCLSPSNLYNIEFVQECLTDGQSTLSSTYQFFMTEKEIERLCENLVK